MAEIAAEKGKLVEIWFQDEARIGQKNKITRRWAKRGTRPSAPKDQRTASAYIFGAICPAEGNVHRAPRVGAWVLISGTWYKQLPAAAFSLLTQPTISQIELVEIRKTRLPLTNKVAILLKSP